MRYALNVSDDGRILSATFEEHAGVDQPLVDKLPDGDLYEYRYIDGEFIHDPLPVQEKDIRQSTIPERLSEIEEALQLILSGVTE